MYFYFCTIVYEKFFGRFFLFLGFVSKKNNQTYYVVLGIHDPGQSPVQKTILCFSQNFQLGPLSRILDRHATSSNQRLPRTTQLDIFFFPVPAEPPPPKKSINRWTHKTERMTKGYRLRSFACAEGGGGTSHPPRAAAGGLRDPPSEEKTLFHNRLKKFPKCTIELCVCKCTRSPQSCWTKASTRGGGGL